MIIRELLDKILKYFSVLHECRSGFVNRDCVFLNLSLSRYDLKQEDRSQNTANDDAKLRRLNLMTQIQIFQHFNLPVRILGGFGTEKRRQETKALYYSNEKNV